IGRGRAFKVNAPGTNAANGGISGGRLVYQQFKGRRSDLKLYSFASRRRSTPPRGVNTRSWEYWPSMSGKWLLFGRESLKSGARSIVLYNLETRTSRRLARTKARKVSLAPGQVNGTFAVWAKCSPKRCNVLRYNIATRKKLKVPNSGVTQYAPSVTRDGAVHFARAGSPRCGSNVRLMRFKPGRGATRVDSLPRNVNIGDTYSYTDQFGNAEVLYDRFGCGRKAASDLFSVAFPRMVKLSTSVAGDGRVTGSPGGLDCSATCSKQLRAGTRVTLQAQPTAGGSRFVGWGGACSGTGPCTVTLDRAKSVTARFQTDFGLTVSKEGLGAGNVTGSGISCGNECSAVFPAGTQVVLEADADPGSVFLRWEGACTNTGPTCEVVMDAAKNVVAVFGLVPTFDLQVSTEGAGSVVSSPGGIDCPTDCGHSFSDGTQVTLQANAAVGSTFAGWGGSCSGTSPSCSVTMDAAKSATARFEAVVPLP
ncbi:MAG TPA: hypothetical protein VHI97_03965, partial [Actinomycetota bacterium]|nr:hypothetical protein [Actinomycetota bacterium]